MTFNYGVSILLNTYNQELVWNRVVCHSEPTYSSRTLYKYQFTSGIHTISWTELLGLIILKMYRVPIQGVTQ